MTSKADPSKLGYIGSKPGHKDKDRDSDSWYTPKYLMDKVHNVLGYIELDPFSSELANKTVHAQRFYTKQDDAFRQCWESETMWMNPPYSGTLCREACIRLVDEYLSGRVKEAIVLVNNTTETKAGQALLGSASAVCFPSKRISFESTDGKKVSGNTRGQMLLYFGKRPQVFRRIFESEGVIYSG